MLIYKDYSINVHPWIKTQDVPVISSEWDKEQEKEEREFLKSYSPRIQKAFELANRLHAPERRKLTNAPYIIHPFNVFKILTKYTQDEDTLCAALLHDVVENVKEYSVERLKNEVGESVANIVNGVSEKRDRQEKRTKNETWRERKDGYLEKLAMDGQRELMICAGDKIDNLESLIDGYEKRGELVWKKFNASEEDMVWFYEEVLRILKQRLDNPIVQELEKTLESLHTLQKARRN